MRISFPGRPIFIQLVPGVRRDVGVRVARRHEEPEVGVEVDRLLAHLHHLVRPGAGQVPPAGWQYNGILKKDP